MCFLLSSSSDMSWISFSWTAVVEIMFSLTTAVRMERRVQLLVTIKKTKANLKVGMLSMMLSRAADSESDWAPLITRKRVNMLSGTVLNGSIKDSSTSWPISKIILWPMSRVVRMPMAYKVTTVSTSTQTTPCTAAVTLTTRMYRGLTDFTSFARRRIRSSRSKRISIISCPTFTPWAAWCFSEICSGLVKDFLATLMIGTSQESPAEESTMAISSRFHTMSGLSQEKNSRPRRFRRTTSSKT
mmetsp:Transcript_65267/g.155790  ORF Transcript_65267/g.155790 Transcript_65267/m.155790 type:complete len:243 (-) Transcript_65267:752-1480(-)